MYLLNGKLNSWTKKTSWRIVSDRNSSNHLSMPSDRLCTLVVSLVGNPCWLLSGNSSKPEDVPYRCCFASLASKENRATFWPLLCFRVYILLQLYEESPRKKKNRLILLSFRHAQMQMWIYSFRLPRTCFLGCRNYELISYQRYPP